MSTPTEDNEVAYVSPADFDEPADVEEDVKVRDEIDLPILEDVIIYLDKELDKCTRIDNLDPSSDLSMRQQIEVQKELARKLGLIRASIKAVIEGIEDKYDETRG